MRHGSSSVPAPMLPSAYGILFLEASIVKVYHASETSNHGGIFRKQLEGKLTEVLACAEEINRHASSVSHSDLNMLGFDPTSESGCYFTPAAPSLRR